MEIKPSEKAISQRDYYLRATAQSARRAALDASERLQRTETHESHSAYDRSELIPRYLATLQALRHEATAIDCAQFSSEYADCLEARATEWAAFAPTSTTDPSLTPECRYVYRHYTITTFDNNFRHTETKNVQELLEIRWVDSSIDYASTPEPFVDLYDTMLILPTGEHAWAARQLDTERFEEQAAIEDFLSTIAEPLVAKLRAQNPALVPLPFDNPDIRQ